MEQNDQPQKFKVPFVPFGSKFNIEVSGYFLRRCQILLMTYGQTIGNEEFLKILEKMKSNQPTNTQTEETVFILVGLVDAMEKAAKATGVAEEKEVSAEELYDIIIPKVPTES